jgi:hypothetical protein
MLVSYLTYSSNPEDGSDIFFRNIAGLSSDYNEVISQKREIFTTTAMITSNPVSTNYTWQRVQVMKILITQF